MERANNDSLARQSEIASTILNQLGGSRFMVMTGARDVFALESGIQFSIPGTHNFERINRVRIILTPADDYTVEFYRVRAGNARKISNFDRVYCDHLRSIFEQETGLYTSL